MKNNTKTHYFLTKETLILNQGFSSPSLKKEQLIWFSDLVIHNNKVIKSRFDPPKKSKRLSDLQIALIAKKYDGVVINI